MRRVYQVSDISPEFFENKKRLYSPYATTASIYFWEILTGKSCGRRKEQSIDSI
jgi:hypothetical protein